MQIVERDEHPHLAVGVRLQPSTDQANAERIARSIVDAVDPPTWGYEFIDVLLLDDDLLEMVRADGRALLVR